MYYQFITNYKVTHYQYLILRNREFSSFGNRKNYYLKSTTTLQGSVMYFFGNVVLLLIAIINLFVISPWE
jgi:hypothetical protein